MRTFLLLSFFFLPMLYAERYQTEFDTNEGMFMPRTIAARYLLGLPIRRQSNQLVHAPMDSSSFDRDQAQQRGKRIYWENLAFHASDYNQNAKKL